MINDPCYQRDMMMMNDVNLRRLTYCYDYLAVLADVYEFDPHMMLYKLLVFHHN